jgi:two-component system NarL family response regulator
MSTLLSTNSSTLDGPYRAVDDASVKGARGGESTSSTLLILISSAAARLRKVWRESGGGFAVAEVTDYAQLARVMVKRRPEILLLDLELPGMAGMSGVAALLRLQPTTKIVVLASHANEKEGVTALKLGARGYCDRTIPPALLQKALCVVQRGEIWVGRRLISALLEEMSATGEPRRARRDLSDPNDCLDRLTPRQRDISELLGAGASNKEMARRLSLTERTVKAHLTSIFRKLGTRGRLETALFITERGRWAGLQPAATGTADESPLPT